MRALVLEHPRIPSRDRFNDIANTPLWSCLMGGYAAAVLKQQGHEVQFLNAAEKGFGLDYTRQTVADLAPDLLLVNTVYIWEHTATLLHWLADLRKSRLTGHLNLFGFFPTLAWKDILEYVPAVDSIAVGECEHTLAQLARQLHKPDSWTDIPGLVLAHSGQAGLQNLRLPEQDPDCFPLPLREQNAEQTAGILASRGCYNHCRFCPVPSFYNQGPLWRGRSPENILAEITHLREEGVTDYYFLDPNFIGPGNKGRKRTQKLLTLLEPLEITFGMETRPNDLSPELMAQLKASGLTSLLLGIESGSAQVLGDLNKSSTGQVSEQAIKICREAGLEPEVGFLMFVPDSSLDDLQKNLDFLRANDLLDRLERTANLLSHMQIVLKGTSGYELFKSQGRLIPFGPLGFEGQVSFRDERVSWAAEVIVGACRHVLREMSQPDSPVYWRLGHKGFASKINDYLISLFEDILKQARQSRILPPAARKKSEVCAELMLT